MVEQASSGAQAPALGRLSVSLPRWAAPALIVAAVLALAAMHLWLAAVQPMWLDESWTAMVAAADWRDLPRILRVDPNPPLYYLAVKLWTLAAGPSNLALRLPGVIALLTTAALPALMNFGRLDWRERLAFGAMLFGWWGMDQFLLGRGFPMLLAIATLQLILFTRLMAEPSTRRALVWAISAGAGVLVHYYAAPIVAAQGVIYLAVHRQAAVRTWPAALAFAPVVAWIAYHLPSLAGFANSTVAWHPRLDAAGVVRMVAFTVQPQGLALALAGVAIVAVVRLWSGRAEPRTFDAQARALWLASAASWLGLALILVSAVLKPTLIARYLTPAAPGVVLTLVLFARTSRAPVLATSLLAGLYLVVAGQPAVVARGLRDQAPYGYEQASQTLIRHGVTDVVFLWDHETTPVQDPLALKRLGQLFFDRARAKVAVSAPQAPVGSDLNAVALQAATGARPGIIWIYNTATNTSAHRRPPEIARRDPRWTCETISVESLGNVACYLSAR